MSTMLRGRSGPRRLEALARRRRRPRDTGYLPQLLGAGADQSFYPGGTPIASSHLAPCWHISSSWMSSTEGCSGRRRPSAAVNISSSVIPPRPQSTTFSWQQGSSGNWIQNVRIPLVPGLPPSSFPSLPLSVFQILKGTFFPRSPREGTLAAPWADASGSTARGAEFPSVGGEEDNASAIVKCSERSSRAETFWGTTARSTPVGPGISSSQGKSRGGWREGRHGAGGNVFGAVSAAAGALLALASAAGSAQCEDDTQEEVVTNWSGTHSVTASVMHRPESLEELEALVADCHKRGQKIRPVGSAISPNGIGLSPDGMVNLAFTDRVLSVDHSTGRVTVQAGARVEQVVEALRPYGLTLENYASVREQQIGGFIQVGAHGTGASIPPVDEQVVGLKLVTPGGGTLDLTPTNSPDLFHFARCGLGTLGVVAEATLQAVPSYLLFEETFVADVDTIRRHHREWLGRYKHIRYMWIPYTDTIVVVRSNPLPSPSSSLSSPSAPSSSLSSPTSSAATAAGEIQGTEHRGGTSPPSEFHENNRAQEGQRESDAAVAGPMLRILCSLLPSCIRRAEASQNERAIEEARDLYRAVVAAKRIPRASESDGSTVREDSDPLSGTWSGSGDAQAPAPTALSEEQLRALSFTQLRDELLALAPLDPAHVAMVNVAEAAFWTKSQGFRVDWSDQILGFDCGGQQWVSEVCFPVPPPDPPGDGKGAVLADIDYVEAIMSLIEDQAIPAPAPIEQRWSCGSRSPLSPASIWPQGDIHNGLFSWVGIIMYLPSNDAAQRQAITDSFMQYKMATARLLWDKYRAHEHWAKIEVPQKVEELAWLKSRLADRYPLQELAVFRKCLDAKRILTNDVLDALVP